MKRFSRYSQWSDLDELQENQEIEAAKAKKLEVATSLLKPGESYGHVRMETSRIKIEVKVTGVASTKGGIVILTPGGSITVDHVDLTCFVRSKTRLSLAFGGGLITIDVENA